jgi:hypothetical protein
MSEVPDAMVAAADEFLKVFLLSEKLSKRATPMDREKAIIYAFSKGWEAAMKRGYPELVHENSELHGIIMDLKAGNDTL